MLRSVTGDADGGSPKVIALKYFADISFGLTDIPETGNIPYNSRQNWISQSLPQRPTRPSGKNAVSNPFACPLRKKLEK